MTNVVGAGVTSFPGFPSAFECFGCNDQERQVYDEITVGPELVFRLTTTGIDLDIVDKAATKDDASNNAFNRTAPLPR